MSVFEILAATAGVHSVADAIEAMRAHGVADPLATIRTAALAVLRDVDRIEAALVGEVVA